MDLTNKSGKPLSVPLPGGKKLFLGPGKTGQVSPKALDHPPLAKLIEEGAVVTSAGASQSKRGGGGKVGPSTGGQHRGSGAMRQSGDR